MKFILRKNNQVHQQVTQKRFLHSIPSLCLVCFHILGTKLSWVIKLGIGKSHLQLKYTLSASIGIKGLSSSHMLLIKCTLLTECQEVCLLAWNIQEYVNTITVLGVELIHPMIRRCNAQRNCRKTKCQISNPMGSMFMTV